MEYVIVVGVLVLLLSLLESALCKVTRKLALDTNVDKALTRIFRNNVKNVRIIGRLGMSTITMVCSPNLQPTLMRFNLISTLMSAVS